MKTIIEEYKVYDFNELNEQSKENAIKEWYENEDYLFLEDSILDSIINEFDTEKVFSNIKLRYSLSYSQGDGLSFSADFDFEKWLQRYDFQNFKKRVLLDYFYIDVNSNNGHYSYAHKDCIIADSCYNSNIELKNIDSLFYNTVLVDIQNYYLEICKKAEKCGYSEIEYMMNFEYFEEMCNENGYTFLEDGTMKNY
jgi:hypothetical protein